MSADLRIVLDTNVVVSALLLRHSQIRHAFDHAFSHGVVLVSTETVEELNDVLRRRKFEKYIREEERMEFLTAYVREAILVTIAVAVKACRDPKDDKFLELAINGQATHVVTGDAALLALHPFRRIPVLTPARFLASLI